MSFFIAELQRVCLLPVWPGVHRHECAASGLPIKHFLLFPWQLSGKKCYIFIFPVNCVQKSFKLNSNFMQACIRNKYQEINPSSQSPHTNGFITFLFVSEFHIYYLKTLSFITEWPLSCQLSLSAIVWFVTLHATSDTLLYCYWTRVNTITRGNILGRTCQKERTTGAPRTKTRRNTGQKWWQFSRWDY